MHRDLRTYCKLCGVKRHKKGSFKLRDGPIDWWFCDSVCCQAWISVRHIDRELNAFLRLAPHERRLSGALTKTISVHLLDAEVAYKRTAGLRLIHNLPLSV
jgi:hypothetical protein